ncbi:MAG: histidine kinase [Holophaga sp.]|nr:histidine kinase [Holophaga sp.]
MHPILKNRARLGTYLLGWVPIAALLAAQTAVKETPLPAALILGLVGAYLAAVLYLSSFFLCRALPIATSRSSTLISTWLAASLVMGTLWTVVMFFVLKQLGRVYPALSSLGEINVVTLLVSGTIGCILYILTVALHYLLMTLEQRQESERTEQELRVLAREAELKALRAQLNPHFLFNSLNSISALTTLDAKRAREMCVLLSDFLRKSLKLGERTTVALSEELDLVRNYLAIEQIRFGSRLAIEWKVDPAVADVEIPTLLLQPLAENAIKHGIAQVMEGGTIGISAALNGEFVEIHVNNPVDADAEAPQGLGLGLKQVKQRLLGRYGGRTFFEAKIREGRHDVVLTFPQHAQEMQS